MNEYIKVTFEVHANRWHIAKALEKLAKHKVLSFDTETAGVYSKAERSEAKEYLKNKDIPLDMKIFALQVAENSGLSFPSLSSTTHFILGIDENNVVILISDNPSTEMLIWNWISEYNGLLLIHNALFDLKIMYHRINKFPKNYEDTQILAKSLINNVEVWNSKVGLKELVGEYYPPSWALYNEYEPEDLKNPEFIKYCAYDGSAVWKLWNQMQEYMQ